MFQGNLEKTEMDNIGYWLLLVLIDSGHFSPTFYMHTNHCILHFASRLIFFGLKNLLNSDNVRGVRNKCMSQVQGILARDDTWYELGSIC